MCGQGYCWLWRGSRRAFGKVQKLGKPEKVEKETEEEKAAEPKAAATAEVVSVQPLFPVLPAAARRLAYEREYDLLRAIRKEEREAAFSLTKSGCMTAEDFLAAQAAAGAQGGAEGVAAVALEQAAGEVRARLAVTSEYKRDQQCKRRKRN